MTTLRVRTNEQYTNNTIDNSRNLFDEIASLRCTRAWAVSRNKYPTATHIEIYNMQCTKKLRARIVHSEDDWIQTLTKTNKISHRIYVHFTEPNITNLSAAETTEIRKRFGGSVNCFV